MTVVSYNVCDQCGNQTKIESDKFCGLRVDFKITSLNSTKLNFGTDIKTFCDKECFLEYFKAHINNVGEFVNDEEEK